MRPDTRSFSFTWLKGSQQQNNGGKNHPNTRSMTNFQNMQSNGLQNYDDEFEGDNGKTKKAEKKISKKELYGCNPSKLKQLKEFGSSLFANSNKSASKTEYSTIQEGQTDDDDDDYVDADKMDDDNHDENALPESVEMNAIEPGTSKGTDDTLDKKSLRSSSSKSGVGKRLNQTVQEVKATIGNFSQKFRRSTRRRYRMTTPMTPIESTPTRKVLGRTPTKLYSPFSFADSPRTTPVHKTPKRLQRPSTPRLPRKAVTPIQTGLAQAYSPSGTFQRDVQDMRRGFQELNFLSKDITRRGHFGI